MELIFAIVAGVVVGAGLVLLYAARVRRRAAPAVADPLSREVAAVRAQLDALGQRLSGDAEMLSRRLEHRLEGIDSRMTQTHSASAGLAKDLFERLAQVQAATARVAEQARQFTLLQDLLKPPKARGGVGEAMLEELLRQVLPPGAYHLQHRFSSGVVVDAAVTLGGRLVCIDSKFPLANYERMCNTSTDVERAGAQRAFGGDVCKHIEDIASRYIVVDENTFDFAVMYVPAEGVYGELLRLEHRGRSLCDIARAARVVPMSPLTMYGYLQTILMGLRGMTIEKSAQRILEDCSRLRHDMERFAGEYEVLGTHLSRAYNKYDDASRKLDRFRDGLERMIDLGEDDEGAAERPPLEVVGE